MWAASEFGARAVALGVVSLAAERLATQLRRVRRGLPEEVELWVGGSGAPTDGLPAGTRRITDLDGLKVRLDLLKAQGPA